MFTLYIRLLRACAYAGLIQLILPMPSYGQVAVSRLQELPVQAQYCAILRALSSADDPRCPDVFSNGQSRGIVLTDTPGVTSPPLNVTVAGPGRPIYSATRDFSREAVPASQTPGEQGYFIQFAFDSTDLRADYKAHLDRLAEVLNTEVMKNSCVKLVGHTDTVGSASYNLSLSKRRANAVQSYLVTALGIEASRVVSDGLGESSPLPDLPGAHPKNRRVEILSRDLALGCG